MQIIENDTTIAVLTPLEDFKSDFKKCFKVDFFIKWGKNDFEQVNIGMLTNIQKACIQAKIEEFETKNKMKWLKD